MTRSDPLIGLRQVAEEIRSGMSDADLMARYGLTDQELKSLVEELVASGLIGPREFHAAALKLNCPACSAEWSQDYEECPRCGVIVAKWKPSGLRPVPAAPKERRSLSLKSVFYATCAIVFVAAFAAIIAVMAQRTARLDNEGDSGIEGFNKIYPGMSRKSLMKLLGSHKVEGPVIIRPGGCSAAIFGPRSTGDWPFLHQAAWLADYPEVMIFLMNYCVLSDAIPIFKAEAVKKKTEQTPGIGFWNNGRAPVVNAGNLEYTYFADGREIIQIVRYSAVRKEPTRIKVHEFPYKTLPFEAYRWHDINDPEESSFAVILQDGLVLVAGTKRQPG